ncbi:MAG: prepilin-type N-terminal cleavage/methylation domain-containing protein [Gammaproteobacteria bacterium]|nr:prepilin-type N-terminal cleavage/methylation domain-containing protein [Gammaproteobacteria bacterium]
MSKGESLGHQGFTLIELVVAIAASGVLMALLVSAFAPGTIQSTDPLFSLRAAELGQSYLEDILGRRYDEASPPGNRTRCGEAGGPACVGIGPDGEARGTYDDADDFDGLSEAPVDASGAVRPGYEAYVVAVDVAYAGGDLGLAANDAKRITVTVTDPRGGSHVYAAYKTNF